LEQLVLNFRHYRTRTYAAAPSITLPRFDNQIQAFIIFRTSSIGGYSGGQCLIWDVQA
jgi:hypothetical protein